MWELNEYRIASQQSQVCALKDSLNAADERIASLNTLNLHLEQEVSLSDKYLTTALFELSNCNSIESKNECLHQEASVQNQFDTNGD